MGKLPFVVAPKVNSRIETLGTDVSGKIEIERKGFLTVGEKGFMANVNSQDAVLQSVMKLSRTVSKKFSIGQQEAYQEVVNAVTDPNNTKYPVFDEYSQEIAELTNLMMQQEQRKTLMMAYCMLLYRVDQDLDMDDVIDLHEDLVGELAKLYLDEESKSLDRLIDKDEENVEDVDSGDIDEIGKK